MPKRILIADESPTAQASLAELFRQEGYDAVVAGDADAMLNACHAQLCDVFLVNLALPGMDSFELLGKLKALFPRAPVVVLSPDTQFHTCLEAMHHGADDVLMQPPDPTHLLAVVRRAEQQAAQADWRGRVGARGDWLVSLSRQIVDDSRYPIVVIAADGTVTYLNRTMASLLDLPEEECLGQSFLSMIRRRAEEIDQVFTDVLERLDEVQAPRLLSAIHMRLGGVDRYLEVNVAPLDGGGLASGVMLMLQDVSRWVLDNQLLYSVVRDSTDAVVVADSRLTIRLWSRGAQQLFGYAPEEIIGQPLATLLPPEETGAMPAALSPETTELPLDKARVRRRRDGTFMDVEVTESILTDHRGRAIGLCEMARDISRDIARLQAIEGIKDFYERVIDATSDGIRVIEGATHRIVLTNKAHLEWIGMAAGDVIGRPCEEIRWGFDENLQSVKVDALIERALASGKPERQVIAALPASKSRLRWQDVMAYPMSDPHGQIEYVVLIGRDITDRVEMEARLAAERDERDQVFMSAPIGILTTDTRGIIEFANPQIAQIFGMLDPEEVVWRNLFELRQIRQMGLVSAFRQVLRDGTRLHRDQIICHAPQGRDRVVNIRAEPLFEGERGIVGLVAVVENVTEQVSLQRRLSATTADLMMLAQIGELFQESRDPDMILQAILVGVTAGEALGFNRAFLLATDWEEKQLRGKYAIGPADREEAARIWDELRATPHTISDVLTGYHEAMEHGEVRINDLARELVISLEDLENIVARAATERRAFLVSGGPGHPMAPPDLVRRLGVESFAVVPLVLNDRVEGVILADNAVTGKPITDDDLRNLELFAHQAMLAVERSQLYTELESRLHEVEEAHRQLKQNHEIMLKNERLTAMGQMAAQVAHEIRNPLVAIGGFARNVLRSLRDSDPGREYLQIIADEASRLEKILGEVLEFSRPRGSTKSSTNLIHLIRRTMGMMQSTFAERRIATRVKLPPHEVIVYVDADQIRQVLQNILNNAVDAMASAGGGDQAGELSLSLELGNAKAVIEIRDTGPGLSDEAMQRLFEPFFTTKNHGTGLGLAICQQIVHDHGGELSVANHPEGGAVFYVALPLIEGVDEEEVNGTHPGDR